MIHEHGHRDVSVLRFLGGRLCLDFVNSIENRAGETPEDFIETYGDLVRWARHRDLVDADTSDSLFMMTEDDPDRAGPALADALELRSVMHRVFHTIATDGVQRVESDDLGYIERLHLRLLRHSHLRVVDGRFAWEWSSDVTHPERLLWPIVESALALLTTGDLDRVKLCANPHGCGWLFYDGSKNGSRRWCSMEGCGVSIKNRRQYAKRRAREQPSMTSV